MLNVPRLGHHPVEPVVQPVPEAADGELEPAPARLVGVAPVVAAVASVVRNHGPPAEGPGGKGNDGHHPD